jgi:putative DNA primase/helicase
MSAHNWMREYLSAAGSANIGKLWQCPSHSDSYPSMSVEEGNDGRALIYCHAGCGYDEVCSALGLDAHLLFEQHPWPAKKVYQANPTKPRFSQISYSGRSGGNKGRLSFHIQHHQFTPSIRLERVKFEDGSKMCKWQTLEGKNWVYSHEGKINLEELPLYREKEVIQGSFMDEIVVLCESESSVDALFKVGIYATTWAGGASQPKLPKLKEVLKDMRVLWIPDNDQAGHKCSELLERELKPVVRRWLKMVGEPGEDARDLVKRSVLTLESITHLFAQSSEVTT